MNVFRYVAIALAGSAGALLRYIVATQVGRFTLRFPLATFIINITGSFLLGCFMSYVAKHRVSPTTVAAIAVGFIGAYTTFSTYMYESYKLADQGAGFEAILYLLGSVIVGILALYLGIMLAR